jgi:hypothetical protein
MRIEFEDIITDYMGVKPYKINSRLFSAQNRERLYWTNIPVIRYGKELRFNEKPFEQKLIDILDTRFVPEIVYEEDGVLFGPGVPTKGKTLLVRKVGDEVRVTQPTKKGYLVAHVGDGVCLDYPTSYSRRGRVIPGKSHALTVSGCPLVYDTHNIIRQFTTLERERDSKRYRTVIQNVPEFRTRNVTRRSVTDGRRALSRICFPACVGIRYENLYL